MAKRPAMIYKGKGFLVKVPARDLSKEEVEKYGRGVLLDTGLYAEPEPPKPRRVIRKAEDNDTQPDEAEEGED